jgi:chromosome segregation ATPase
VLESSREKSQLRINEIEDLLERERAITSQRQSLSEGAAEEVNALSQKLGKVEKHLTERDKKIAELEKNIEHRNAELLSYEKAHIDSLEREQKFRATIQQLEQENSGIERQLELLREERGNLQIHLGQVEEKDNSYALVFSQDERLNLLKTIDSLIERVDTMSGHYGDVTK